MNEGRYKNGLGESKKEPNELHELVQSQISNIIWLLEINTKYQYIKNIHNLYNFYVERQRESQHVRMWMIKQMEQNATNGDLENISKFF